MGFNVYLPAGTVIGNIETNKFQSTKKNLKRHATLLISLIYFVKNCAREVRLKDLFCTELDI